MNGTTTCRDTTYISPEQRVPEPRVKWFDVDVDSMSKSPDFVTKIDEMSMIDVVSTEGVFTVGVRDRSETTWTAF